MCAQHIVGICSLASPDSLSNIVPLVEELQNHLINPLEH